MIKSVWAFLCVLALSAVAAPAVAQVPAPCSAVGYNTNTFDSDFKEAAKSFDESGTYLPGYRWYRWNWFNIKPNIDLSRLQSDGSISASGDLYGNLVSAARSKRPPGFVGTAFGGGACVEVKLRFDPAPRTSSEPHPSFWAMSKEHLDGSGDDQWPGREPGFTHFVEWDILEYFKVRPPGFHSGWIDWYGPYIAKGELKVGDQTCRRPFCSHGGSFDADRGAFPPNIDWNQWQTVIGVWKPATAERSGCIQTFLNGIPIAPQYCWPPLLSRREKIEELLDFSLIDRHHMVLVIGSGGSPIFVRSVRVYQQSSRENLSN